MNPDITPLIRARNALKASEDAERNGDMALALRHANEAVAFSAQWRASIMGDDLNTWAKNQYLKMRSF